MVLVGGSTRMPLVRRSVEELFGRGRTRLNPDEVVALGARSRPASWPAAGATCCCSTSPRCRSASRPWAA